LFGHILTLSETWNTPQEMLDDKMKQTLRKTVRRGVEHYSKTVSSFVRHRRGCARPPKLKQSVGDLSSSPTDRTKRNPPPRKEGRSSPLPPSRPVEEEEREGLGEADANLSPSRADRSREDVPMITEAIEEGGDKDTAADSDGDDVKEKVITAEEAGSHPPRDADVEGHVAVDRLDRIGLSVEDGSVDEAPKEQVRKDEGSVADSYDDETMEDGQMPVRDGDSWASGSESDKD
jgi:hypothetical protein